MLRARCEEGVKQIPWACQLPCKLPYRNGRLYREWEEGLGESAITDGGRKPGVGDKHWLEACAPPRGKNGLLCTPVTHMSNNPWLEGTAGLASH